MGECQNVQAPADKKTKDTQPNVRTRIFTGAFLFITG